MADRVTDFLDEKFDDYRSQISIDISKGLSKLSSVIAIWTMILICMIFAGLALGLGIGALIGSYLVGFAIVAFLQLLAMYLVYMKRTKWIEEPIYNISKKALRGRLTGSEEDEELLKEVVKQIEEERKES